MKKMNRIIAVTMVCILAAALTSCAADGGTSDTTATITVWHIWTNPFDANARAFTKVLEDYKAAHPNVDVQVESIKSEDYKTKINDAISANKAPDVFFSWGADEVSPFVEAEAILPLDEYLDDEYRANIYGGTLDNFTFHSKIYGLTMYQWVGALYCNQEMFDVLGITPPETYEDLLAAVALFKKHGIVPIGVGAKDSWHAMFLQNILAVRTAGAKNVNSMLSGSTSFDSTEIVKSAQYINELAEAGAFDRDCLSMNYDAAKAEFLSGKIPMFFIGEWFVSDIQNSSSRVKDKVVAVNFPALGSGHDDTQILGGANDGFVVNAHAHDKNTAVEFVKYLTENMSIECFRLAGSIPTRAFNTKKFTIDPLVEQIMGFAAESTGAVLTWDKLLPDNAAEKHKTLCQQIFTEEITPEKFALEMAKLQ